MKNETIYKNFATYFIFYIYFINLLIITRKENILCGIQNLF